MAGEFSACAQADQLELFNDAAARLSKLPRELQVRTLTALIVMFELDDDVVKRLP